MIREQSGNWNIVFLKTLNALEFNLNNDTITFNIIGGIIHFKFFFGDKNPETVIRKYHQYINGYTIIPFWSFGNH